MAISVIVSGSSRKTPERWSLGRHWLVECDKKKQSNSCGLTVMKNGSFVLTHMQFPIMDCHKAPFLRSRFHNHLTM